MMDKEAAEKAIEDPNPYIDGRRANVNLAYLGAKPKLGSPGEFVAIELDLIERCSCDWSAMSSSSLSHTLLVHSAYR